MTDVFPGIILHPTMAHHWRLNSWTVDGVDHCDSLTLMVNFMEVIKSPSLFKAGQFRLIFDEDIHNMVANAIEERKGRVGSITFQILNGDNTVLKTIELEGVKIKNHRFHLDYAASETIKADLDCSFKKMVIY